MSNGYGTDEVGSPHILGKVPQFCRQPDPVFVPDARKAHAPKLGGCDLEGFETCAALLAKVQSHRFLLWFLSNFEVVADGGVAPVLVSRTVPPT